MPADSVGGVYHPLTLIRYDNGGGSNLPAMTKRRRLRCPRAGVFLCPLATVAGASPPGNPDLIQQWRWRVLRSASDDNETPALGAEAGVFVCVELFGG